MIQLILNNTEVFPERDTSIKMIRENPVLTESGSYTLDVNLPLSIMENVRFFGPLHHIEVSKDYQRYDCELRTYGRPLLVGTAVITKVTDQAVTIQILAGNSNMNFRNLSEKLYIDDIDFNTEETLGKKKDIVLDFFKMIGADVNPFYDYYDFATNLPKTEGRKKWYSAIRYQKGDWGLMIGGTSDFVFMPVWDTDIEENESAEKDYHQWIQNGCVNQIHFENWHYGWNFFYNVSHYTCVQPKLLFILNKVVKSMGYDIIDNFMQGDPFFESIFIGSVRPTFKIADALPHWTVKEFLTEFQNLFNVTIVANESTMEATVLRNGDFKDVTTLTDIIDESECEVSEEGESKSIATSTIKYKNIGKYDYRERIEDSSSNSYATIKVPEGSWDDFFKSEAFTSLSEEDLNWSFFLKDGVRYVWWSEYDDMTPVDFYGPLFRDGDQELELKIVPCPIIKRTLLRNEVFVTSQEDENYFKDDLKYFRTEPLIALPNSWGGYLEAEGSLLVELKGGKVARRYGEKEDFMGIFFFDNRVVSGNDREHLDHYPGKGEGGSYDNESRIYCYDIFTGLYSPKVRGYKEVFEYVQNQRPQWSMDLQNINPNGRSIGELHKKDYSLETKVEHKISFLSHSIPDVRSKFLIRGKLFACKKIEVNVSDDGIDPLLTGYFVEIKS